MFTKDFVYAARSLAKSPVFMATAVLTIALGIGASTAIFSVTNAVLLRPLPYKDPGQLIIACGDMRKRNVKDFPFSNAEYFDIRETDKNTFEDFAGVLTGRGPVLRDDGTVCNRMAKIFVLSEGDETPLVRQWQTVGQLDERTVGASAPVAALFGCTCCIIRLSAATELAASSSGLMQADQHPPWGSIGWDAQESPGGLGI